MFTKSSPQAVRDGLVGAAGALANLATPFLRGARNHWGLSPEETHWAYPGDELVRQPTWMWTHAVDIHAEGSRVWPWVVQLGQDKAGFYSYEWLENLAGCQIHNARTIHPEWQTLRVGDALLLHPKMPPLVIGATEPGRWFVATNDAPADASPEVSVSWLFLIEPRGVAKSRLISRFRVAHAPGLRGRLSYGPWLTESIGFVMDRAMLLGIKRRVEAPRS